MQLRVLFLEGMSSVSHPNERKQLRNTKENPEREARDLEKTDRWSIRGIRTTNLWTFDMKIIIKSLSQTFCFLFSEIL